jgi:hypothetical protein
MKLKFGVLIIGAVVVLFIGLRFFLSKSKNNNFNNLTFENSGVNLENKENQRIVRGEVTSWDWKKGRLMLWSGNKNLEIMVEPAKMMVFTANPTKNTDMLPLLSPVLRSTPTPQARAGRPREWPRTPCMVPQGHRVIRRPCKLSYPLQVAASSILY